MFFCDLIHSFIFTSVTTIVLAQFQNTLWGYLLSLRVFWILGQSLCPFNIVHIFISRSSYTTFRSDFSYSALICLISSPGSTGGGGPRIVTLSFFDDQCFWMWTHGRVHPSVLGWNPLFKHDRNRLELVTFGYFFFIENIIQKVFYTPQNPYWMFTLLIYYFINIIHVFIMHLNNNLKLSLMTELNIKITCITRTYFTDKKHILTGKEQVAQTP